MIIRVPREQPSIQAAADVAHPGDTIYVSRGVFCEEVRINKPNLLVQGSGPDTVLRPSECPGVGEGFFVTACNTEIRGFTITGFDVGLVDFAAKSGTYADLCLRNNAAAGICLLISMNTMIRNVFIAGSAVGLCTEFTCGVDIERCAFGRNEQGMQETCADETHVTDTVFEGNTFEGYFSLLTAKSRLADSECRHNGLHGVTIACGLCNVVEDNRIICNDEDATVLLYSAYDSIRRNRIAQNGASGVFLQGVSAGVVEFNRISRNHAFGVALSGSVGSTIRHNYLFHNRPADINALDSAEDLFDANQCTEGSLPPGLCC